MRDLVRRVGQRVMVGFHGPDPSADVKTLIREFGVGHVILFARNVVSPEQVAALCRELQDLNRRAGADLPLLIAVDQEGGRVARLRAPWTVWPPLRALGRIGDERLARELGAALAVELRACGIRWDFAPVVDVDTNPKNPIIGDRSFGDVPELVGRLGVAFIPGLEGGGVASCAKHFPGHGDTDVDSHLDLPSIEHSRGRIEDIELRPFRDMVAAQAASIMTAHVLVREFDETMPATLSPRLIDGLLRKRNGLRGRHRLRRPRDEGDRQALEAGDRRGGRGCGRLRRAAGLRDHGHAGGGHRGPGARRRIGNAGTEAVRRVAAPHPRAQGALLAAVRGARPGAGARRGRPRGEPARSRAEIAARGGY